MSSTTLAQGKAKQSYGVSVVTEGQDIPIKLCREGSLSTVNFIASLSAQGKVFVANVGTVTTQATLGADAMDGTEWDLHVAVPTNVVIIPLSLHVQMETFGTAEIFELLMMYGTGSAAGTVGSTITPTNINIQSNNASACTVTGANNSDGTAFTGRATEIYRNGYQRVQNATTTTQDEHRRGNGFDWNWTRDGVLHLIGPSAQLGVMANAGAGSNGTGYLTLVYAETPSSWWV